MKISSMVTVQKVLYLVTLINIFWISSVFTKEDENAKEDKKSRLYSCLRLANIMIQEDKDYLPLFNKEIITNFKTKTFDELFEELKDKILLTCYTDVSAIKSAELISSNTKAINPFTKENKSLLSPNTFKDRFYESGSLNIKAYNKHLEKMREVYSLLLDELLVFEEKVATFLDYISYDSQKKDSLYRKKSKKPYSSNSEEKSRRNENDGGEEYLDDSSYSNLNLNLLGYNLNDPKIKNTLGLFLLVLVFIGIYLSYRTVVKKGSQISNGPKKSKKDRSRSKEKN